MLRSGGKNYTEGDISEWIVTLSEEQTEALKKEKEVKDARQLAKIYNFGLLYGMKEVGLFKFGVGKCGLKWSQDDASAGPDGWFECLSKVVSALSGLFRRTRHGSRGC